MTWKTNSRTVFANHPPNTWNHLDKINSKQAAFLFPQKYVASEEQCINLMQEKVIEEQNIESIKKQYQKKKIEQIHQKFIEQHKQNMEKEKKLKLGVFGKYIKQPDERYKLVQQEPVTSVQQQQFPTKFSIIKESKSVILDNQNQNEYKLNQLFSRLSQPKQQYIPKELIEYGDFRGLLLADLDENTVIKNQVVTDQFKSTSRVNQLKIKTMYRPNSSNSAYTVVRRPPSFQMLKGAYDTHEKSADVIMLEKNIQQQTFSDLDDFDKKLNKMKTSSGFCQVKRTENLMMFDSRGFFKVKQL